MFSVKDIDLNKICELCPYGSLSDDSNIELDYISVACSNVFEEGYCRFESHETYDHEYTMDSYRKLDSEHVTTWNITICDIVVAKLADNFDEFWEFLVNSKRMDMIEYYDELIKGLNLLFPDKKHIWEADMIIIKSMRD